MKHKTKKSESTLYIKGFRKVNHGVFSVGEDGQKTYRSQVFNKTVPYAGGQQLRRCIKDSILDFLDLQPSHVKFTYKTDGKKLSQKNALTSCNPKDIDQLLGGYMNTELSVSRTSPISSSALTPLHDLLCKVNNELIVMDRKNDSNFSISLVKDGKTKDDKELSLEDMYKEFGEEKMKSVSPSQFIPDNKRVNGVFVYTIEINLKELFSISLNQFKREVTPELEEELVKDGWEYNEEKTRLLMPKDKFINISDAIAKGIMNWKFTSNKTNTLDCLNDFAVIISNNAQDLNDGIFVELEEESNGTMNAKIVVDDSCENLFYSREITSICPIKFNTKKDIRQAEKIISNKIKEYYNV